MCMKRLLCGLRKLLNKNIPIITLLIDYYIIGRLVVIVLTVFYIISRHLIKDFNFL